MNKLILCEGKTDAILLSYYLDKMCGWKNIKKGPKSINIKLEESKQECGYWYQKDTDLLFICGVGGKDNFKSFFQSKIIRAITDTSETTGFSKIAIVTDRDDRDETMIANDMQSWLKPIDVSPKQNEWTQAYYENGYGQESTIDVLLLVIPTEHEGALESVLLDAISEDPYDKIIVDLCGKFVEDMVPYASKYIHKRRLRLKSHLAVTWGIQSPGKEFYFIDEQIKSVKWENSNVLQSTFEQLLKI